MKQLVNTFIKTGSVPEFQSKFLDVNRSPSVIPSFLMKTDGVDQVVFANHRFVVAGISSNQVLISEDGVNWSSHTVPAPCNYPTICHVGSGSFYISYYVSDTLVRLSSDFNSQVFQLPVNSYWFCVRGGDGKFLMADNQPSNIALYTMNGTSWNIATLPTTMTWRSIVYVDGMFVLASQGGDKLLRSSDFVNWESLSIPNALWHSMSYGNGRYVLIDLGDINNGSTLVAYSDDCVTWNIATLPVSLPWHGSCFGAGRFVAVPYGGSQAVSSLDGVNWVVGNLPRSSQYAGVAYGNGMFVAVGVDSVAYSSDGINWQAANVPTGQWYGVGYGEW